jgi:glutamyl-tRNA synthetase
MVDVKDTQITRTRFAPSPTGLLHVGAVRTALFAWLLARQNNGVFVLRLEDTDKKREVAGADEHIMRTLRAVGLDYDEGPDIAGDYGPYRQSQRLEIYKQWAQKLIDSGRAYADPYTTAELQAFREQAQQQKQPFLYRNHRPENPPAWDGSTPLRFKSDPKSYNWKDAVMGELSTGPEVIDDFILIKSDGYPTYNFAHIVDDYLMEVSQIVRGQEFIASVPNYMNLYDALNLQAPIMATLPPILGPDGKKKLSKRDGAQDVLDYLRQGFLPEALLSFIATLGWNDGTEQELFSVDELVSKFSLDQVGRGGAVFDERRLHWVNGSFIRKMDLDTLYEQVQTFLPSEAQSFDDAYNKAVVGVLQERLKYFAELPELTQFFYTDLSINPALISEHKKLKKYDQSDLMNLLQIASDTLASTTFEVEALQNKLNQLLESTQEKPAVLFSLIRIAITQTPASPGLAETMAILGRERTLQRINNQINALQA